MLDILLGLVQGLTEFVPVSSSGHLVVVPAVLGAEQPSVSFDLLLHVATLAAVVVYFRSDLAAMARGVVGRGDDPSGPRRLVALLALGTVPAAAAGLLLGGPIERLFDKPLAVCAAWGVTAAGLLAGEWAARRAPPRSLGWQAALVVGTAQAVALVPGISRSGATIAAGLALGIARDEAARFAFLLAIPAIAGGGLTLVPDVASGRFDVTWAVAGGFVVAAVSGYAAVAAVLRWVRTRSLAPFSAYLLVAAALAAPIVAS